jgi:hypothetical protein
MIIFEGHLDIVHAVSPAFIKHLTLMCEWAQRNFINLFRLDKLNKNISASEFALDESLKSIDQKLGTLSRNLVWYFYLSELQFVILYYLL